METKSIEEASELVTKATKMIEYEKMRSNRRKKLLKWGVNLSISLFSAPPLNKDVLSSCEEFKREGVCSSYKVDGCCPLKHSEKDPKGRVNFDDYIISVLTNPKMLERKFGFNEIIKMGEDFITNEDCLEKYGIMAKLIVDPITFIGGCKGKFKIKLNGAYIQLNQSNYYQITRSPDGLNEHKPYLFGIIKLMMCTLKCVYVNYHIENDNKDGLEEEDYAVFNGFCPDTYKIVKFSLSAPKDDDENLYFYKHEESLLEPIG